MSRKKYIIPKRFLFVGGTFTLPLLLYMDRVCISTAKTPIANSLNLKDTEMGWVLSIFALGYALFQVPGGAFADRYGAKKYLTSLTALWCVFTSVTGAAWSFVSLMIIRFIFGAGEAGAYPGITTAVYKWIPTKERGIVNGINFSGSRIGAAIALPITAWLISAFGWRSSFMIIGCAGIIWTALWFWWFRDYPEDLKSISEEEKKYIVDNRQYSATEKEKKSPIRVKQLLKSKNMWIAMGQYFCSNFTFFFALTWLYPFIKTRYQISAIDAGLWTSIPLIFGAIGNWVSGIIVDKIYSKGKWELSRKLPAIIGFSLASAGLIISIYMSSVEGSIASFSLAIMGADMTLSPSWSFCIDIGKIHSGTVSGTMNMAGNIGSFITALAFPYLYKWSGNDVSLFFITGAVLNVFAIAAWLAVKPQKSITEY